MGADIELYDPDAWPEDGELVVDEDDGTPAQPPVGDEIARVQAELDVLQAEAAALVQGGAAGGPGTALVPVQASPVQAKRRLARTRSELMHKQAAIAAKADEMRALLDRRKAELDEVLRPMQQLVQRIEEAIWTVNLYLGREEQIVVLRTGNPAPATEVLHVRQLVLAMDEETALYPEDEGIDYRDLAEFDQWLLASPAHLDQVLPEQKGVVALVPRYDSKRKEWGGDPEADAQTYWLLRNGENLYRMATDFQVGRHLVPLADEFTSYFHTEQRSYRSDGGDGQVHRIPITPGTRAWEQAEERADARQRHYMRVALVLQGLLDRTTVFHPLPDGGIDMLRTWAHDHQQVRFIYDADASLGTGREPFGAWLARLNAQLRPGMRVVCNFGAWGFQQHKVGDRYDAGNSRVRPQKAKGLETGVLYQLEGREGRYLYLRFRRTDTVYGRHTWDDHVPERRATCLVDPQDDKWVLPFDLVTEAECLAYLEARTERHAYVDMFPVLKAAIAAKREEAAAEAPFRTMLAGVLARDNGVSVADAEQAVPGLVDWWKLTLRNHRPLVGDEQQQAAAVQRIVAEHARQLRAARRSHRSDVLEQLQAAHPDAMLIARRRDNWWAVYVPANDGSVWVHRRVYTATGIPKPDWGAQWRLFPKAQLATLQVLYSTERLAGWNHDAALGEHLTDPERDAMGAQLARSGDRVEAVAYDPHRRQFYVWHYEADAVVATRPLSGRHEPPQVREVRQAWRRSTGGRPVLYDPPWGSGSRPNWSGQVRPWIVPQNEYNRGQRYDVLYVDEAIVAHYDSERARYEAAHAQHVELWHQVRSHMDGLEAAWRRQAEAQAYAKFIEDYDDPALWEGHLKLIERDLRYPHQHHTGGSSHRSDQLYLAVQWLVERGERVAGLTAAQAVAEAQAAGLVYRPDGWDRLPAAVPDDVASLVFPPLSADDTDHDGEWEDVTHDDV